MKSARKQGNIEHPEELGETRTFWQYGFETVWAVGAGVMAARLLP